MQSFPRFRRIPSCLLLGALMLFTARLVAAPPAGYYDSADTSSPAALRATLHAIIDDHQRFPYTSSATDTWDILELADEDPANSSRILDVYKNESYPKAGGGNSNYDREHTWPKSFGFPNDGACNYAYTDTHHLMLCDSGYNSSRSNKPYVTCSASCGERTTTVNNGWGGGTGTYPGNSNWTSGGATASGSSPSSTARWETWGQRRGDVARAMFYLAIRYEGGTHGVTGCDEPDLELTDVLADIQSVNFNVAGTGNPVAYMGLLSDLLQWHADDPVDALELERNDIIYSFQGNRNPFVDHPEWVECIFLGICGGSGAPAPPTMLAALAGDGQVSLDWDDNVEADLAGYTVYRSTSPGVTATAPNLLAVIGTTSAFVDNTAANGTTYYYVVTARNNMAQESGPSNEASAKPVDPSTVSSTVIASAAITEPPTILALRNTWFDAPWIFDFTVQDDFANPSADTLPTLIEQLSLGAGAGNTLTTFSNWIEGARISDGTSFTDATIGSSSITFVMPTSLGSLGHVPDNGSKTYQVKVWFKESVGDPSNFDGRRLALQLANSGIQTPASGSSGFGTFTPVESGASNLEIEVVADRIVFVDQPVDTAVGADNTASLQAIDRNGNRDLDATAVAALTLLTADGSVLSSAADPNLQQPLVAGYAEWTDLRVNQGEAGLHLLGTVAGLASAQSEGFTSLPLGGGGEVFFNEIHYDNSGTDVGEFIEVAGPAGTNLSGYSIVLYNGSDGEPYNTLNLAGIIPNQQNGFGVVAFDYPVNGIQNGSPDGMALAQGATLLQFLSYEGTFLGVGGVANGVLSTDIGVAESGTTPIGFSLRLSGSGNTYDDFTWQPPAAATKGSINTGQTFTAAGSSLNPNGVFEFADHELFATELDGVIQIDVNRLSGTTGAQQVAFSVTGGTATGADYILATASPLNFPDGATTAQISFTIQDDGDHTEIDETVILELGSVTGGGELGVQDMLTITILGSRESINVAAGNPVPAIFSDGVRARVDFSDVAAPGPVQVTLYRDPAMVSNLTNAMGVVWEVSPQPALSFTGETMVTFTYTDAEALGIDEGSLQLYKADSPSGPWTSTSHFSTNPVTNEITGIVDGFSFFTGGDNNTLAVELASLFVSESGGIATVIWSTSEEVSTAGFYVRRADASGGRFLRPMERLSESIIPAEGAGGSYSLADPLVLAPGEVRGYFLEELELGGESNYYGPVTVQAGSVPASVGEWWNY